VRSARASASSPAADDHTGREPPGRRDEDCPGRSALQLGEQRRAGDRLAPQAHDVRVDLLDARRQRGQLRALRLRARQQAGSASRAQRRRRAFASRPASAPAQTDQQPQPASASAAASVASMRARAALPRSSRASSRSTLDDAPPATRALTASSSFATSASALGGRVHARQRQLRADVGGAHPRPRLGARHRDAQLRRLQRVAHHRAPRRALPADLDGLFGVHEVLQAPLVDHAGRRPLAPRTDAAADDRVARHHHRRADVARGHHVALGARRRTSGLVSSASRSASPASGRAVTARRRRRRGRRRRAERREPPTRQGTGISGTGTEHLIFLRMIDGTNAVSVVPRWTGHTNDALRGLVERATRPGRSEHVRGRHPRRGK
jgi:hypothetical protein